MLSLCLSVVISIFFDAIAKWGEIKAKLLSNYEILQFRLWTPLKLFLILIKIFLLGHLFKTLYVHSFYTLYYYHHYDYCLVNIVILYRI